MLSKKIVKYIQSLSHKKFRDEEGVFIAEGPKVVSEFLLSEKFHCNLICAEKEWLLEYGSILKSIVPEDIHETDDHWLQSISLLKTPNKVVAVFEKKPPSAPPVLDRRITLMMDDLQDPGNMGTIIRIADWFAVRDIICSKNCVDCYNSKVVQSTMGSLSRVNIFYTDLIPFIQKNKKINLYAAALEGTSIFKLPKIAEGIILIGNESKGVHNDLLQLSSQKITIPRYGHAESLNAAVATGIVLSHILGFENG
ncbi:MAG: RNA methyltransferase [Ginsengibacter sp.]